jgi:hypothetical protein
MDADASTDPNFRVLADATLCPEYNHVADHCTTFHADRFDDYIAIRKAHIGPDGGLIRKICGVLKVEQRGVTQPQYPDKFELRDFLCTRIAQISPSPTSADALLNNPDYAVMNGKMRIYGRVRSILHSFRFRQEVWTSPRWLNNCGRRQRTYISVEEGVSEFKSSASFRWWYDKLLLGLAPVQRNLEWKIQRDAVTATRLDLVLAIIAAVGALGSLAALQDLFPYPKQIAFATAIVSFSSAVVLAVRNFFFTTEKQQLLFDLHEAVQSFATELNAAILTDDGNWAAQKRRHDELRRRVLRVAPELVSDKGWDDLTEEERMQAIQQSYPA